MGEKSGLITQFTFISHTIGPINVDFYYFLIQTTDE